MLPKVNPTIRAPRLDSRSAENPNIIEFKNRETIPSALSFAKRGSFVTSPYLKRTRSLSRDAAIRKQILR